MAQRMQAAGYETHIIGKWHLGHYCPQCLPTNRGFDTFYGFLTGAEDYETKSFCINIADDGPEKCGYDFYKNRDRNPKANGTYSTYQFRDAAKAVIEENHLNYIETGVKEGCSLQLGAIVFIDPSAHFLDMFCPTS